MNDFPQPKKLGRATRWSPADLHAFEQVHELELPPLEGMANIRQVAARYGVSVPTIWRWAAESRSRGAA